jgi:RNA polymerase sigma-70 factor (ECF subfamily)
VINTPDDDTILQRAATGDPDAVRECLEQFGPMVWSMARQSLGNSPAAEDAVQDVFIDLWKHAGRFDPRIARARAFVSTIAKRRIIDRYRTERTGVKRSSIETAPEPAAAPQDLMPLSVETDDRLKAAAAALDSLPFEQRSAIKLHILDGMAHQAIADRLGMPLGTVKSHLRRGLMKVREMLGVQAAEVRS